MNKYSKILTDNIFLNKVFEMISIQENKIQCLFEKKKHTTCYSNE